MEHLQEHVAAIMQYKVNAVQLVKHFAQVNKNKVQYPARAQLKYDGVYMGMYVMDGRFIPVTRKGKPMHWEFSQDTPLADGFYMGELVNPTISLETLSGLVNPNRVTPWKPDELWNMRDNYRVKLHDYISLNEFARGRSSTPYYERLATLQRNYYDGYADNGCCGHHLDLVESITVWNEEDFINFANKVIASGGEGAVMKQSQGDWQAGRKDFHVVKLVRGIHKDLRCVGWKFGVGKREGQIASLSFAYKSRTFKADLGTGWTDEARTELTKRAVLSDGGDPIGRIFHVYGLQESSKGVIRLPKVAEERVDKTVSDDDDEISK